ncbi:hypothetical protein B9Z55_000395 [Caenorhabditis nigoni]|nr:hypothetical protein B9Z55_000395 [Caenorhabditis nigoni]
MPMLSDYHRPFSTIADHRPTIGEDRRRSAIIGDHQKWLADIGRRSPTDFRSSPTPSLAKTLHFFQDSINFKKDEI